MEKEFDIQKSIIAQREFVKEEGVPHFAPQSGTCWKCHNNIYRELVRNGFSTGIDVDRAGKEHITGCPHCNRSYCE